jgi:hypothetical protein
MPCYASSYHAAALAQVVELAGLGGQLELSLERLVTPCAPHQLVEDVEGALTLELVNLL